ncbi:SDR family NAD(P)-dependent oxidoreductase [Aurantiacibacter suaedae]|uniref:SDR family NAD(P)-dependent oxidoreductase n=1 Tax=Aurantiacibacter suaedae TaxID=2545755 RepID=UPI0010F7F0DE|nr:SDR family NAD(P)-dependent oxidoreductase [Aurantiacibacter suaedae]
MDHLLPPCNSSTTPEFGKRLLITGASGALGRALALHHARSGSSLSLWGRNPERLASTAEAVRAAGAEATERRLDLTDCEAAIAALAEEDAKSPFDLVYLVAGIGDVCPPGAMVEPPAQIARVVETNFTAPAAMAAAMAERMARRGHGRIVIVGSAAGHHALPSAASYAASKAGLARFADALRIAMKPRGVSVVLVAPGFIASGPEERPMAIPVRIAARRIAQAAERGKRHYVTPWPFTALRLLDKALPTALRDRLLAAIKP